MLKRRFIERVAGNYNHKCDVCEEYIEVHSRYTQVLDEKIQHVAELCDDCSKQVQLEQLHRESVR
jgi:hypothetical protein